MSKFFVVSYGWDGEVKTAGMWSADKLTTFLNNTTWCAKAHRVGVEVQVGLDGGILIYI